MSWKIFWAHRSYVADLGGRGFSLFSLPHGAIGTYIVARYAAGEIRPRYAGVWLTLLVTAALAGFLYPINRACNTNFMFLLSHEDNPALKLVWNLSGGAGGFAYILGLGALAILIFHLMYAFYALLRKARRAEKSGEQT